MTVKILACLINSPNPCYVSYTINIMRAYTIYVEVDACVFLYNTYNYYAITIHFCADAEINCRWLIFKKEEKIKIK